jgi:hypothetical protein
MTSFSTTLLLEKENISRISFFTSGTELFQYLLPKIPNPVQPRFGSPHSSVANRLIGLAQAAQLRGRTGEGIPLKEILPHRLMGFAGTPTPSQPTEKSMKGIHQMAIFAVPPTQKNPCDPPAQHPEQE